MRVTVFLDCEGVIVIDVIQRGKTINLDAYISTLKKMRKHFQQVWPDKKMHEMLLQRDNTRPHMYQTLEAITQMDGQCYHINPTAPA
jgi:hypothetical protein